MKLFVYGTLQIPEVVRAVTGRRLVGRPAVLEGYERRCLRGRTYPGIARAVGRSTAGLLFPALEPRVLELLDDFEGALYERRVLTVKTPSDGRSHRAQAYVVSEARADLLTARPWDGTEFAAKHLAAFLARCERFRSRYLPAD